MPTLGLVMRGEPLLGIGSNVTTARDWVESFALFLSHSYSDSSNIECMLRSCTDSFAAQAGPLDMKKTHARHSQQSGCADASLKGSVLFSYYCIWFCPTNPRSCDPTLLSECF